MNEQCDPPVAPAFAFVVGAERSGTTMLRGMLDCHSALAMVYEPHVVTELDTASVRRDDGTLNVEAFAKAFIEHRWFRRWEVAPEEVEKELARAGPVFYAEAVRCVYAMYARRRGKQFYGDKSPSYIFRMAHIAEQFPEARFVHLVRDGRDAARSLQQVPFGPDDFPGAVARWREWVTAGLRAGTRLGPRWYLQIRYEDLVREPKRLLAMVCGHFGFDFEPQMLRFHERATEVLRHERPHYHDHLSEPLRADLRDWRCDLTPEEIETFDRLAGDLNRRLGYAEDGGQ